MKLQVPKMVFEASEVAAICETDVATIYTWVKKGEIPHFKTPGGRLRFKREAVLDFLRRYHFPVPAELSQGRSRVIVFDHDAAGLPEIRRWLVRSFDVMTFRDPYDALMAIGSDPPDAVVLDVQIPGFDGLACIRRIRAREALQHTRVIVFSSAPDFETSSLAAGAAAFVLKPSTDELHNRLRQALGSR